jgi:hypothetical protein
MVAAHLCVTDRAHHHRNEYMNPQRPDIHELRPSLEDRMPDRRVQDGGGEGHQEEALLDRGVGLLRLLLGDGECVVPRSSGRVLWLLPVLLFLHVQRSNSRRGGGCTRWSVTGRRRHLARRLDSRDLLRRPTIRRAFLS